MTPSATTEREIVFWQRIVSIHQASLVAALADISGVKVTYVAEQILSDSRRKLGWAPPSLGEAELVLVDSPQAVAELLPKFSAQAIHICEGFRKNGLVGVAQKLLRQRKARILIHAETIDDQGLPGIVKRVLYSFIVDRALPWADSILAIGRHTPGWFARRGFPESRVFPFAYFLGLPPAVDMSSFSADENRPFQIAFVGSFIPRKRLDLLMDSLVKLADEVDFQLSVVGTGPLENQLRRLATARLGARVIWHGLLPATEIPEFLAGVDCLVLPSRYDGWGAVVSEALLVGTPAICSDTCGAAEAVKHSATGGVFPTGDADALAECLRGLIAQGPVSAERRAHLAAWAQGLGGPAGARYLIEILRHRFENAARPVPPWRKIDGA